MNLPLRRTSEVYTDAEQLPTKEAIQTLPAFSDGDAQGDAKLQAQSGPSRPVPTHPIG